MLEDFKRNHKNTNVFLKNLNDQVDDKSLALVFGQCGEITSVAVREPSNVPTHISNKTKFAFMNFKSHDEAKRALEKVKGLKEGDEVAQLFANGQGQAMFFKNKDQLKRQKEQDAKKKMSQPQQNMYAQMQQYMNNPMFMMMMMNMMNMRPQNNMRMPNNPRGMNMMQMPGQNGQAANTSNPQRMNPMMNNMMPMMPMMPMMNQPQQPFNNFQQPPQQPPMQ